MRQRLMIGLLVILVGLIRWRGYGLWRDARVTEAAPSPVVMGTIDLDLDGELLARLDKESLRLMLESDDGDRLTVSVWRVRSDLTMTQFVGLQPAHYRALLIDWGDGARNRVSIDVNLMPAELY